MRITKLAFNTHHHLFCILPHLLFRCQIKKSNSPRKSRPSHPKIAVAAYVENGGFGAAWAAPIASLMVEKYLNGEIAQGERKDLEARMRGGNLLYKVRKR